MFDQQQIEKQAKILIDYSTRVKKNEVVCVVANELAKPLVIALYKRLLQKEPKEILLDLAFDELAKIFFDNATEKQIKKFPQIKFSDVKKTDVYIAIRAPFHTRLLTNTNPEKIALRSKVVKKITDWRVEKTRWVITEFPTMASSIEADMAFDDYAKFVFGAICDVDWKSVKNQQENLKLLFDKGKRVKLESKDTNLTMSIAGRTAISDYGENNMPGGEVFTSVVESSTNGYIRYTFPAIYQSREVMDIYLEFKNGKVTKAKAVKGEDFLQKMLQMDSGAKRIGELGIGNNYMIDRFVKNILFDEKIGGTVHLALGKGYKETKSKNISALHWDMICDLRSGGKLYLDDKLIQMNGKWLI